jgi:hypothetical protein
MRVNVTIVLDDEQLRRVRATTGRGGRATRAECRVWLQRVMQVALAHAPEPKRRRVKVAAAPAAPKVVDSAREPALPEVEQAPVTDETRCQHCKRRRENHGRMSQTCPPGFGARVGSRFAPAVGG